MTERQDTGHIDVRYVAELARLALTDEEVQKFQGELDEVLAYMDKLRELDLEDIAPTALAASRVNVWRDDIAGESIARDAVIRNAPASREDVYIRVPPMMEG